MTQNIYDNGAFFQAYSQLRRSREGLDGAAEWPALRAMLPEMGGLRVLDLGCGFGWFCRWAREAGAAAVLGIDVSANMLGRAREMTDDPAITYVQKDLERLELGGAVFDLAYSSLALHYIEGLDGLLKAIHAALVPGGRLVFSMEHPIFTAPSRPGWAVDAKGRKSWPVDDYLVEGARRTDWLAPGVIKQHRTLGTVLNAVMGAGFTLRHVEEWVPTAAQIAALPAMADELLRPMFVLVSGTA